MSNLDSEVSCQPHGSESNHDGKQLLASKQQQLTAEIEVSRTIPQKLRRSVGPFCFVDHFGPTDATAKLHFDVAPHPHIGLQTLSWLWSGEVLHLDSLGSKQWLRPGQVNLMTAGRGISHAEVIPEEHAMNVTLHGVQLWLALPPEAMQVAPDFEHFSELPQLEFGKFQGHLILGKLGAYEAPAKLYAEAVAFDLHSTENSAVRIDVNPKFEHLVYVVRSSAQDIHINGMNVEPHSGLYLAKNTACLEIEGTGQVLVLGGVPYPEPIRMFWNFVANDNSDLYTAAKAWNANDPIFGHVDAYPKYGKGPKRLMSPEPPESFNQNK